MSCFAFVLRAVALIVAVGAVTTVAAAADDDFEFAEALSNRGYVDLAEEKFLALIKKGGTRKGDGEYGLSLLKQVTAVKAAMESSEARRKSVDQVLGLFEDGDQVWAAFLKNNPTHKRELDAKLARARLLQQNAEYILKAMEKNWESAKSESDLGKLMASAYDTSVSLLKPVEEKAKAAYDKAQRELKPDDPAYAEISDKYAVSWLYRLVSLYGKGASLPVGDASGTAALKQVVAEVEDFLWEFEDRLQGVWALHYRGLAWAKLDDPREAFADMKGAATLANPTEFPPVRKVTFDSYSKLGELCLQFGARDGEDWPSRALKEFRVLDGKWSTYLKDQSGQKAGLVWARLLDYTGDPRRALEVAQGVLSAAVKLRTGVDREAGIVVGSLLTEDSDIDPGDLERLAASKWREGDYRGCIRAYQSVVRTCKTAEQKNEYAWNAWKFMGQAYALDKRFYEAFLCFDAIEKAWEADRSNEILSNMTNTTGWDRLNMLTYLSKQLESTDAAAAKEVKTRFKALLEEFAKNHPDSPMNMDAGMRNAATLFGDARSLRRTDPDGAKAKFREALKGYKGLSKSSKQVALIEARLAEIHYFLGEFDKAVSLSEAWLAKKRNDITDSRIRRAQAQGRNIALTTLLRALYSAADTQTDKEKKRTAWQNLLDGVTKYEADFLKASQNGERAVTGWKIEGLIGVGKVDEAEKLAWTFIHKNPKHPNSRFFAAVLGAAVEREATSWLNKGDVQRSRGLFIRAAKLKEFVLDSGDKRSADVVRAVGATYQKGGDFTKAEALLKEGLAIYEATGNKESMASVRVQLIDLLVDQGKFDEAIPQLEAQLAADPKDRQWVLDRLMKDTSFTKKSLNELLGKMSKSKGLLNSLSKAYLKAKTAKRLVACMNLSWLLQYAHPKDKKHDAEYIEYTMRLARANFVYGVDERQPEALDNVVALIQTGIITVGLMKSYEEARPGTEKEATDLLENARRERGKLK